jgi:osmotically-inducible protein OsmY
MKNDMKIQHDVLNELDFEPMIDAAHIAVTVKHGVVTLRGTVRDLSQKWVAERAVRRIAGVKLIADEIEVALLPRDERTDPEIEAAVMHLFGWHVALPAEAIRVAVSRGWVTIEGEVNDQFQKIKAEEIVRDLRGVRGVTNLIALIPKAAPIDVRTRIDEALRRLVGLTADNIDMSVQDGLVTLVGEVHSWAEREAAERVASSAPGITQVHNQITVVE